MPVHSTSSTFHYVQAKDFLRNIPASAYTSAIKEGLLIGLQSEGSSSTCDHSGHAIRTETSDCDNLTHAVKKIC